MTKVPPERKEAEALLKKVESLLKEKEAFKDTTEYQEAQKVVEEVKRVVNPKTGERFIDKDPKSAVLRLKEAKKNLEKLR